MKPIYAHLGEYAELNGFDSERVDLVDTESRQRVIRMLASIPHPGEFRDTAFEDWVDLQTVRAVVLAHRFHDTGVWQVRIDGIVKPRSPIYRPRVDARDPDNAFMNMRVIWRHWGDDYADLHCLTTPYTSATLPDHSSRLVARTIAHFASQIFGEDKRSTWQLAGSSYRTHSRG